MMSDTTITLPPENGDESSDDEQLKQTPNQEKQNGETMQMPQEVVDAIDAINGIAIVVSGEIRMTIEGHEGRYKPQDIIAFWATMTLAYNSRKGAIDTTAAYLTHLVREARDALIQNIRLIDEQTFEVARRVRTDKLCSFEGVVDNIDKFTDQNGNGNGNH